MVYKIKNLKKDRKENPRIKYFQGYRQDRNEKDRLTFWGSGYGLRRNYVEIAYRPSFKDWVVITYKNRGFYEDAKRNPDKYFKSKSEAINHAKDYMRNNPS
jgi:hypothetical protein